MNVVMSLYLALLFVAFVPGVLLTLPSGGSKYTVLAVHAILFTLVWQFTHMMVLDSSEPFQGAWANMVPVAKRPGNVVPQVHPGLKTPTFFGMRRF